MTNIEYLSEHFLSQNWLSQFTNSTDRALAVQLIDQLKLVSERLFESDIEQTLINLQTKLKETIAVYPISPPNPDGILGYKPFIGSIPDLSNETSSKLYGRRQHYGSEHKVGHVIKKIQEQVKSNNGCSRIECSPTLTQLTTQGIQHIVFVDDLCGSGKRIIDYWKKVVPKRIKSLLSLKKMHLWIVLYAISPTGKKFILQQLPNFPIENLLTVLPESDLRQTLTDDILNLCRKYANYIGIQSSELGYRNSACPIIFEHGCPNNAPIILWKNYKKWKGLFPNGAIPNELRQYFDGNTITRTTEILWKVNQPQLALSLLEKMKQKEKLNVQEYFLFTFLGLAARRISTLNIQTYLILSQQQFNELVIYATELGLYTKEGQLSDLGKAFLNYYRKKYECRLYDNKIEKSSELYYPHQCEGKLRWLGKTN